MSENQSKTGRDAIDPEAGREIPRGSDEESNTERSSGERDDSAQHPKSPSHHPDGNRPHGK